MFSRPPNISLAAQDTPKPLAAVPAAAIERMLRRLGKKLIRWFQTLQGLGAFALITLGVLITKLRTAPGVMRPLFVSHISNAGVALLPLVLFLAAAVGFVVIGQTLAVLSQVGANSLLGSIMTTVVVRELGPMMAALIVLARSGIGNVIELGAIRSSGEVEALEALTIDPIHFLVVPRLVGMVSAVFALTTYFILGALTSGYVWAFLQDFPLLPGDYFGQIAVSLRALDFVLLGLKTIAFGVIIAIVTCYHGLAKPLRVEDVPSATIRAVGQSTIGCMLINALFLVIYLATQ